MIAAAGGPAAVYGMSSGAALARGGGGRRGRDQAGPVGAAVHDRPHRRTPPGSGSTSRSSTGLLDAGRRGDAMALFMTSIGLPEAMIAGIRQAPMWPGMEALAPTLAYDATVMGDSMVPAGVVASVKAPTLVLDGRGTGTWAANAARALTAELPNAARRTLDGQDHNVAWDVLAPLLKAFLTG